MAGKKGQKWATDRPEPRKKLNINIKPELYDKIQEKAELRKWTMSHTIEELLNETFKNGVQNYV